MAEKKVSQEKSQAAGQRNIYLLGATSFFTDISSEMIYPLIPLFLTSTLGATPGIVGIIEGIAESLAALLKVVSGNLSDRLGQRRNLAFFGYSFSTAAKFLFYTAGSWGTVMFGRIGDRFGKGIRTAPRDALIARSAKRGKTGTAFGLHRAMDTLGATFGAGIAYLLIRTGQANFKTIFLWALVPAGIGLIFLLLVRDVSSTPVKLAKKRLNFNLKGLVSSWNALPRKLKGFLIITLIFTLGNSSNQFLLLRVSSAGYNTAEVLFFYLLFNLSYALLSYPAGKLADRIGAKDLIVGGYLIYGIVYTGFALFESTTALVMLFVLYGIYLGATHGVAKAVVADLSPSSAKGTLLGLHATVEGLGLLPASMLAGLLWNMFGPAYALGLGGLAGLTAALGMMVVLGKN